MSYSTYIEADVFTPTTLQRFESYRQRNRICTSVLAWLHNGVMAGKRASYPGISLGADTCTTHDHFSTHNIDLLNAGKQNTSHG